MHHLFIFVMCQLLYQLLYVSNFIYLHVNVKERPKSHCVHSFSSHHNFKSVTILPVKVLITDACLIVQLFAKMNHILKAGLVNSNLEGHLIKNIRPSMTTSGPILTSLQVSVFLQATEQMPSRLPVLCTNRYLRSVVWLSVLQKGNTPNNQICW